MALSTTFSLTLKKKHFAKFVSVRMLTHPKSIMGVLCLLTYLSLGNVTLLRGEFQSPKHFHTLDLRPWAASRWAFPHISSLFIYLLYGIICRSSHYQ